MAVVYNSIKDVKSTNNNVNSILPHKDYYKPYSNSAGHMLVFTDETQQTVKVVDCVGSREKQMYIEPVMTVSIRTYKDIDVQIKNNYGLNDYSLKANRRYVFPLVHYIFIAPNFELMPDEIAADVKITGHCPECYTDENGNVTSPFIISNNINLDVSELDYFQCETLQGVFQMSGLQSINNDVLIWDTSNITSLNGCFSTCMYLENADLSAWDTSSVTDMSNLFSGCSSLVTANLSELDTSRVTNMSNMFLACSSLQTLDLSSWDLSSLTKSDQIFNWCSSLSSLKLGPGWGKAKITNLDFAGSHKWHDNCHDSIMSLLEYDRKGAGQSDLTISLAPESFTHFKDTEITQLKAKGYIVRSRSV